jgi:hypothetical protein
MSGWQHGRVVRTFGMMGLREREREREREFSFGVKNILWAYNIFSPI